MQGIEEVANDIFVIEPDFDGVKNAFSMYIIRGRKGIVIETGPTITIPLVTKAIEQLGINDLSHIMLTHVHLDHAGGAGTLSELYPNAEVLVHPEGLQHLVDPSRLINGAKKMWGENVQDKFGQVLPIPESRIRVPKDNEVITIDGRDFQIIFTMGHASHHMVIFEKGIKGLFCGDALGWLAKDAKSFPYPAVSPPDHDHEIYLENMVMLTRLRPRKLFFSHGSIVNTTGDFMALAIENARMFADIAYKGLNEGITPDLIYKRAIDYASNRYNGQLNELDVSLTAASYEAYYRIKGLN